MKVTFRINATPVACLDAWIKPELLNGWLSEHAVLDGKDLALASSVPNISGRHHIVEHSDSYLRFDWYINGYRTDLELRFEPKEGGTAISLNHQIDGEAPKSILFPPGKHYGDQSWIFAMCNLRIFLENGKRGIVLPSPVAPHTLALQIGIDAPAAEIWKILTVPEQLSQTRLALEGASIEPRLGGRYSFGWPEEDEGCDGPGHITEWQENQKLAFTWHGGRDSQISFHISPADDSGSLVDFTHTGLEFSLPNVWSYQLGWSDFLFELKFRIESGDRFESWVNEE